MDAASGTLISRSTGLSRLLEHCEAAHRLTGVESGTARLRLEHALGTDLATRLVYALAPGRRGRVALPL